MTTVQQAGQGASAVPEVSANSGMAAISGGGAIVQSPSLVRDDSEPAAQEAVTARIPVEIDVAVPIRDFQVRKLLALATGQIIATRWVEGEDMPLGARGTQLAWTEFEVVDQKLAVRITRLM
jgi:flagellar motor switch/type III secretory pathway protein FliN